jgi:hypothetical protein
MCRTIPEFVVCACSTHHAAVSKATSLAESVEPHALLAETPTGPTGDGTSRCDHQSDLSRWTEGNVRLISSNTLIYIIGFVESRAEPRTQVWVAEVDMLCSADVHQGREQQTRCKHRRDSDTRVSTETNAAGLETCVQFELENELQTLCVPACLVCLMNLACRFCFLIFSRFVERHPLPRNLITFALSPSPTLGVPSPKKPDALGSEYITAHAYLLPK